VGHVVALATAHDVVACAADDHVVTPQPAMTSSPGVPTRRSSPGVPSTVAGDPQTRRHRRRRCGRRRCRRPSLEASRGRAVGKFLDSVESVT
jgi:hypothetical protein